MSLRFSLGGTREAGCYNVGAATNPPEDQEAPVERVEVA